MVEILPHRVIKGHFLIRGNCITQSGKAQVASQGTYERKDKFKASPGHSSNVLNAKIQVNP